MPVIRIETRIQAPMETCFDLARNVNLHMASTAQTRARAVAGVTAGLLGLGDVVTWEATHFGIRQRLTAQITRCERPDLFEDEQVQGVFAWFRHTHEFHRQAGATLMVDVFRYASPLGVLGVLADKLFLERYMTRFLQRRAAFLKRVAESGAT